MGGLIAPARRERFALTRNLMVRTASDRELILEWRADLQSLDEEMNWPSWRRFLMSHLFNFQAGTKVLTGLEIARLSKMTGHPLKGPPEETAYHVLEHAAFKRLIAAAEKNVVAGARQ